MDLRSSALVTRNAPQSTLRGAGALGALGLTALRVIALTLAALTVTALTFFTAQSAGAAATAGTAEITTPGEVSPLHHGGSATLYGVLLPSGASCPGDTAHQGYHVFSYLVPEGVSPASVSFKTGIPSKYFGYIAQGAYFGAVNTDEGSGQIVGIPSEFTWTRLTPTDLFAHGASTATWNGGIACADIHGVVTDYWNSEIVFRADASDPGGFTWTAVQAVTSSSNTGLLIGIVLIALALVLGVVALVLRRRTSGSDRTGGPSGSGRVDEDPAGPRGPVPSPATPVVSAEPDGNLAPSDDRASAESVGK